MTVAFAIVCDGKIVRTGHCPSEDFARQAVNQGETVQEMERFARPSECEIVDGKVKIKE